MPKGIWVKDMPGFEDWVLLQQPKMTEAQARSYGEVHLCLESDAKVTREMTFTTCALTIELRQRAAAQSRHAGPASPARRADLRHTVQDSALSPSKSTPSRRNKRSP